MLLFAKSLILSSSVFTVMPRSGARLYARGQHANPRQTTSFSGQNSAPSLTITQDMCVITILSNPYRDAIDHDGGSGADLSHSLALPSACSWRNSKTDDHAVRKCCELLCRYCIALLSFRPCLSFRLQLPCLSLSPASI